MTRIDSKFKKSFYLRLGRNFLGLTLQSIADELSEADSSSFVRIFFFFFFLVSERNGCVIEGRNHWNNCEMTARLIF